MALESPSHDHPAESGQVVLDTASVVRGWLDGNRMRGVLAGLAVAFAMAVAGNAIRVFLRRSRQARTG